jgi:aarF domain-containing kinase
LNGLDKWHFNPEKASEIEKMHERVAARFHSTIVTNQGLWIKAGQALGLQAALLPKPYRTAFSDIFDDAPTVPYGEIENVFKQDLAGQTPEDFFAEFGHVAVNSASIAQVHRAKVKRHEMGPDGKPTGKTWLEDVAVKVSKIIQVLACTWMLMKFHVKRFKSLPLESKLIGTCGVTDSLVVLLRSCLTCLVRILLPKTDIEVC